MQPKSERVKAGKKHRHLLALAIAPAILLSGCASTESGESVSRDVLDQGLGNSIERPDRTVRGSDLVASEAPEEEVASVTRSEFEIPELSPPEEGSQEGGSSGSIAPRPTVDTVNVTMDTLPTERFIDLVFGQMLGVPYTIGEGVSQKTDQLRLGSPVSTDSELFLEWVTDYLESYQIRVIPTPSGYEIVTDETLMNRIPILLRNRMRNSVETELRPVVHFVELQAVNAGEMAEMLGKMLPSSATLLVEPNLRLNILTLTGLIEDVDAALEIIDQLDELPYAGTTAERYSPAFWSAEELSEEVLKLLEAEGWQASVREDFQKPILILPIDYSNDLFIFARDPRAMARTRFWLSELDRATRKGDEPQTFVYTVQNVDAEILAKTVNAVLDRRTFASLESAGGAPDPNRRRAAGSPEPEDRSPSGGANGTIVVNRLSNQLIFSGTASQYGEIRPLLVQLDQAPAEVLIEVTVAEITLSDGSQYGVQVFIDSLGNEEVGATFRNNGLGLGAVGSNVALFSGNVEAAINFFARNNLVNVLSTPRLMARSGGSASITVGTEVPVITSQRAAETQDGFGNTDVLQSVDYRSTGVLLSIEPIVFGDNRIDLSISQEVSSAISTTTSSISSPTISNRSVTTQLSLEDGETAVLGGLITTTSTLDEKGTPILKDIPIVGPAFRNTTLGEDKTELLILITAYVLRGTEDKRRFTDALVDQFNRTQAVSGRLQTMTRQPGAKPPPIATRHIETGKPLTTPGSRHHEEE